LGSGNDKGSLCVIDAQPNASQAEAARSNSFVQQLFGGLPARYDLLAELLSFGQNGRWRQAMVQRVLANQPAKVLDVATGTAGVAALLARAGGVSVTGVDLTGPMLRRGQSTVEQAGLRDRVALVQAPAQQLPFPDGCFDALTFTYLLRYVRDPLATLTELARVLKPGGTMASLEFYTPARQPWRACWRLYTRNVLPAAGWLGGRSWHEVGAFLGPSIAAHYERYSLDWTVEAWRTAGLVNVGYRTMSLGGGLVMWGRKRDG
jgi:demethylmenaquinone methyltransferase / 2-methoxy-6-polyprenyl-1,4-benzoquinol methylase